eukprot:gene12980-biopygen5248
MISGNHTFRPRRGARILWRSRLQFRGRKEPRKGRNREKERSAGEPAGRAPWLRSAPLFLQATLRIPASPPDNLLVVCGPCRAPPSASSPDDSRSHWFPEATRKPDVSWRRTSPGPAGGAQVLFFRRHPQVFHRRSSGWFPQVPFPRLLCPSAPQRQLASRRRRGPRAPRALRGGVEDPHARPGPEAEGGDRARAEGGEAVGARAGVAA